MSTPRTSLPWWAGYAVGAVAASIALGLMVWQVVTRGPFIAWDWPFHEWVDPRVPTGAAKTAWDGVASALGQRKYTLPILAAVALVVARRQKAWRPLMATAAGLATVFFVGYAIKGALRRTPPALEVDMLFGRGEAFPSGHTANATLTWMLIAILLFSARGAFPHRRRFLVTFVGAVCAAVIGGTLMTVLDYHWLSDIPGGWTLGALALCVAMLVFGPAPAPSDDDDPAVADLGHDQSGDALRQ